jgi:multiple sugar transport system ATP-binding protein
MAGVTLQRLTKSYGAGNPMAVKDLTLEIADGEFLVLVGPSGCGKSTALRMIAGLEEISDGALWIGDQLVNEVHAKDRNVAMVFQNYALYPHLSVRDNIAFPLQIARLPRAEIDARVTEAARILELEGYLRRRPGQLSGGQRQRVAMGRAIVRRPAVYLMDEPLSNLDAKLRVQMRAEITQLQQRLGTTMIYVTHDQVEAMTMGHRVALLKDGELQQVDPPKVIYERPRNLFVAAFIGAPTMNLYHATLAAGENGGAWLQLGSQGLALPPRIVAARQRLAAYLGRRLIVGMRPEDLSDASTHAVPPLHQVLCSTASLVEALGSDYLVHFGLDAEMAMVGSSDTLSAISSTALARGVARFANRSEVRQGSPIRIAVDIDRLHFFDPETTEAIA